MLGLPAPAVDKIVHRGKPAPGNQRFFKHGAHDVVREGIGAAEWADGHTDGTVRANFTPIVKTAVLVQLPSPDTVGDCFLP